MVSIVDESGILQFLQDKNQSLFFSGVDKTWGRPYPVTSPPIYPMDEYAGINFYHSNRGDQKVTDAICNVRGNETVKILQKSSLKHPTSLCLRHIPQPITQP